MLIKKVFFFPYVFQFQNYHKWHALPVVLTTVFWEGKSKVYRYSLLSFYFNSWHHISASASGDENRFEVETQPQVLSS